MFKNNSLFILLVIICGRSTAQQTDTTRWVDVHFQQTIVTQYHPSFKAPYTSKNSLVPNEDPQTSLTSTLFLEMPTWHGAKFVFNPEIAGGSGLSQARGIAGFTNGETFRVGNPTPTVYVARLFVEQNIQLGKPEKAHVLTLSGGKFCLADFFDNNRFSHDPRSQFFNWSLMSNGAWDYPANTRGYTWGMVAEYSTPAFTLRAATSLVPDDANGPYLDLAFHDAHAETIELERPYHIANKAGCLRVLVFNNHANMGNYQEAIQSGDQDITQHRHRGATKYGWAANIEQDITPEVGVFAKASWNDGKNETWAFTEIDESISTGLVLNGHLWHRDFDCLGVACVCNGLSSAHQEYLAKGGYGFIIGDGQLNYAPEMIAESYYAFHFNHYITFSPDYQWVINPAYNKDRGPVQVLGLRGHVEF